MADRFDVEVRLDDNTGAGAASVARNLHKVGSKTKEMWGTTNKLSQATGALSSKFQSCSGAAASVATQVDRAERETKQLNKSMRDGKNSASLFEGGIGGMTGKLKGLAVAAAARPLSFPV